MSQITLRVGDRNYVLACRDGEEGHLLRLAAMIDRKCAEATASLGVMPEPRLLLTAALLIADELTEAQASSNPSAVAEDSNRLETIATQIEALCLALEQQAAKA